MLRIKAQEYRDLEKAQIQQDIRTYELFNSMCKIYPVQTWHPSSFTQDDQPLVGERKQRNKIAAKNSRIRKKNMKAELKRRISKLEIQLQPNFTLKFTF